MSNLQFDFGENWNEFSQNALNQEKIADAKRDFIQLIDNNDIKQKTFLDIGFGQGLTLLTATTLDANTVGCDINSKCKLVLESNKKYFKELITKEIPVIIGSILEHKVVENLELASPDKKSRKYDIVHSWGVLHHTGKMWKAIEIAAGLVDANGLYIIAIYNCHWSSSLWLFIKWIYNISPNFIKKLLIYIFYFIIAFAKWLVTFKNPFRKERGMNFYYDVVDWLGGYPYEYATTGEIISFVEKLGFKTVKYTNATVPTGCNEFVFKKI